MRYRALDASGDYVAGAGAVFYVNSPEAVAQAVKTRLRLFAKEWFLDRTEGLDMERILGYRTQGTRDQEVQQRIIRTQGVRSILSYASQVNATTREFTVNAVLDTIYGAVAVNATTEF